MRDVYKPHSQNPVEEYLHFPHGCGVKKKPTNITLAEPVLEFAAQVMAARGFTSFSAFVEDLIRTEYERRSGPLTLKETSTEYRFHTPKVLPDHRPAAKTLKKR